MEYVVSNLGYLKTTIDLYYSSCISCLNQYEQITNKLNFNIVFQENGWITTDCSLFSKWTIFPHKLLFFHTIQQKKNIKS